MSYAENKRQRQETIELKLSTSSIGLTVSELVSALEVDRSTIFRDLQEIGGRVTLIRDESSKRYRISPGDYVRNVRLTQPEALTMYLALRRFIRQTSHAPAFFSSAIHKVATALHHPLLVTSLGDSASKLDAERQASSAYAEIWNRLIHAWYECVVVKLDYRKGRQNQIETHAFEPYLFEPAVLSHGTYVMGWSRTRSERRTFKIERIQHVSLTAQFFERDDHVRPDDLLRDAWGVWYGAELKHVVLRFAAEAAPRVRETVWHPSQVLEDQPDGSLLWSVDIAGPVELVPWIRGWGHEVEVLAPESLRRDIAESLRRAAGRYET